MVTDKIYIIFFRSEEKFKVPRPDQFPFEDKEKLKIITIDVGDSYQEIKDNFDNIWDICQSVLERSSEIFLCGAIPNGFTFLLSKFLLFYFPHGDFIWLQIARQKGVDPEQKKYEIWKDLV